MATYRLFCYNPSANGNISGTEQVGDIAAATGSVSVNSAQEWWNGPDEDLGYVVCYVDASGNRPNSTERLFGGNIPCHLGFKRSVAKTDESFLSLSKRVTGSQSLSSASAAKTLLNSNGYWTSWTTAAASYLLDTYGGAAAAYSLRKLSSTYSGSAIRVRRSSDNTEQNIGFDGSGNLDTTALTTFVGAGNGFVTTWYDQSGSGRDATQSSASQQPLIVSSGTVITLNGKPSLSFDGANDTLNFTQINVTSPHANYLVGKRNTVNKSLFSFNHTYVGYEFFSGLGGDGKYYFFHSSSNFLMGTSTYSTTSQQLISAFKGATAEIYNNNSLISTNNGSLGFGMRINNIGFVAYAGEYLSGELQETIFWLSDQSSNRSGINSNINTYYSIYPTDADAAAFVSAAGITDSTQQSAVNTLVTDLKSANIWTKMMAIYPFVGGTATSHKFNLKDPRDLDAAYRLVFNGGWTHSSTGALPNGTNGHADTKFKPSNLSQNNNSFGFYSRTNIIAQQVEMGINPGYSGTLNIGANFLGAGAFARNFPSNINVYGGFTNTDTRGLYLSSRILSTEHKMYKNNTTLGTITVNSVTPDNTTNIALSAEVNVGNTSGLWYSTKELAFAFMGYGLTDAEVSSLYTAVQAFQTTLGRQV